MNQQDKEAACNRICGEAGKRGMHRMAPEMCPFKEEEWKRPPKRTTPYGSGLVEKSGS